MPTLTKYQVIDSQLCDKRTWLMAHEPPEEDASAPDLRAEMGREVGVLARRLFPGGQVVTARGWRQQRAETERLLADPGCKVIHEAAFEADGVRVRADILVKGARGLAVWEVKASGQADDGHFLDLAIQRHVIAAAGHRLADGGLVLLDKDYVRGARLSPRQLLRKLPLSAEMAEWAPKAADIIAHCRRVVAMARAPRIETGVHCRKCPDFRDRCTRRRPEDWIANLPFVDARSYPRLMEASGGRIRDIPATEKLRKEQALVRRALQAGGDWIDPGLAARLDDIGTEVMVLDFETCAAAIPAWPGTSPLQAVPFQWSGHTHRADGRVSHAEFLADGTVDPSAATLSSLLAWAGGNETPVLVWSPYEATVLKGLAERFPRSRRRIEALRARLVDLCQIARQTIYLRDFSWSWSLKTVGPALAPHISYDDLPGPIRDGDAAQAAFLRMARSQVPDPAARESLRQSLLAYCHLDTLALLEVWRGLRANAGLETKVAA